MNFSEIIIRMLRNWAHFGVYAEQDKAEMNQIQHINEIPQQEEPNENFQKIISKIQTAVNMNDESSSPNYIVKDQDIQNGFSFIMNHLETSNLHTLEEKKDTSCNTTNDKI